MHAITLYGHIFHNSQILIQIADSSPRAFLKNLFILFLAVLGLRCWVQAFSSCDEGGLCACICVRERERERETEFMMPHEV